MIIVTAQTGTGGGIGGGEVSNPTPAQVEASYLVTLTDTNGKTWDLNNGPVTLLAGVNLFAMPPLTHWTKVSPAVAGSRWKGLHVDERQLILPIRTAGKEWDNWRDIDQEFFSGLDPFQEATITVTSPDAVSKTLTFRFQTEGDGTDDIDPLLAKRRRYSFGMMVNDPFWHGSAVKKPITFSDPLPTFPGPPFLIAKASDSRNTTISNPGDVDAWLRYTVVGPAISWQVGVGDSLVSSSSVPIGSGSIFVDSQPGVRTIVDDAGARQYKSMDTVKFAPVPPGVDVPIVATMTGATAGSRILVELTPSYWRCT